MSFGTPEANKGNPGSGAAVEAAPLEPLCTRLISDSDRIDEFRCSKSERVQNFFKTEYQLLVTRGYCRVWVFPASDDEHKIWGYYSLSAATVEKESLSGADEKRSPFGFAAPMVRIGFLGRDDSAPKGLGSALLVDAARRVHRNPDIGACGIVLESDGGPANKKLWAWYQQQGFKVCRKASVSLYAPLSALIPEFTAGG
jgi:GNAT superfamily N-acetyltransferase